MAVPFSQKPSMPKTITEPNRDAELGVSNEDKSVPQAATDNARPLPAYLPGDERITENAKVSLAEPANDNKRLWPPYLLDRSARQREPGLLFEYKQMRAAIAELGSGGTGMLVPDALRPYHITCNDFYFGVCTPGAVERPHWHHKGWESYTILAGEAEMLVKWHEEVEWRRKVLYAFDTILIAPGVCHWLRWSSEDGYCVVHKAPTLPGIGLPPKGKQQCATCHLYKNGCVLPDGFNPV
jgi:hypothetical protein